MSELSRRGFLGSAAFAAGMAAPAMASDGVGGAGFDHPNGADDRPDAILEGKGLPTFKFELEKSEGKVIGGSYGKEATVEQLPISKGIAGVSMKMEPGVIRELHWHATAAEWAYVIGGRVRTTVIGPDGTSETDDFEPGDIWYFPRGHGHSLQCLGNEPCRFILIFDNGYFSEFGTFSITDWMGHTPRPLLAKNLGVPESALAKIPAGEVYFARGEVPPEEIQPGLRGPLRSPPESHKFRMRAQGPHSIHKGGREWRVGQDLFPISKTITGVVLELEPGGLRELHWHPTSDEWQYVIGGSASVTMFGSHGRHRVEELKAGDVGYIPRGYGHSIENVGDGVLTMLIGFNTGHYAAIDLSTWIASNPKYLLRDNLGLAESTVETLPNSTVFIASKDHASTGNDERPGR